MNIESRVKEWLSAEPIMENPDYIHAGGLYLDELITKCIKDLKPVIEADGWISVDNDLPDESKMYLITNGVDCDTCLFVETRAGFASSFIGKATHWQPLPEPPTK